MKFQHIHAKTAVYGIAITQQQLICQDVARMGCEKR